MALIKCRECGNDVSNKALSCPNCGEPVVDSDAASKPNDAVIVQNVVKTEETAKVFKAQMAIAFVVVMIGLFFVSGIEGWIVAVCGAAWFIGAKVAAWWNHG